MPELPPHACVPGCSELVPAGVARCPTHTRKREQARGSAHQRGYDARWRKARLVYLQRHPLCRICEAFNTVTAATLVDHIVPHRGDQLLFWDESNWQSLCASCHDMKTATEDGGFGLAASFPPKLPPPLVPLVVVAGSPGSGKTTLVAQWAAPEDLVLDLDVIKSRLSGAPMYEAGKQFLVPALTERNAKLFRLGEKPSLWPRAWLIACLPNSSSRAWWAARGAHIVLVHAPLADCLQRVQDDDQRRDKARHQALVRDWHNAFQPSPHDEVFTSQGGAGSVPSAHGAKDRCPRFNTRRQVSELRGG